MPLTQLENSMKFLEVCAPWASVEDCGETQKWVTEEFIWVTKKSMGILWQYLKTLERRKITVKIKTDQEVGSCGSIGPLVKHWYSHLVLFLFNSTSLNSVARIIDAFEIKFWQLSNRVRPDKQYLFQGWDMVCSHSSPTSRLRLLGRSKGTYSVFRTASPPTPTFLSVRWSTSWTTVRLHPLHTCIVLLVFSPEGHSCVNTIHSNFSHRHYPTGPWYNLRATACE